MCPISTYSTNVTCEACHTLCYNCSIDTCFECDPGYYVYNNTCTTPCPAGFINNSTHCISKPIVCPSFCLNCPADNQCTQCQANYNLLNNLCYDACPQGYFISTPGTCSLFVPPAEAKYFPFAFVISGAILFIGLAIIKCF